MEGYITLNVEKQIKWKKFKEINGKPYCLNSINYMAPIQSNCI